MVVCKFASKVMLFQKTLQYCETIDNYYNRKTTIMISACVLNQYHAHWLLSYALHSAITMNTKLMEELENALTFDNIMDEDFWMFNELTLASNIKKEVSIVFHSFHFLGRKYEQRKTQTRCP
jgi:hypothetical protein